MSCVMRILSKVPFRNVKHVLWFSSEIHTKSFRDFHSNPKLCYKMHLENENKYAYTIMEKNGYSMRLSKDNNVLPITTNEFEKIIQENWAKKKPNELINYFSQLGTFCSTNNLCMSNKMFDNLIDSLTDNVRYLSDQELELLFYSVTDWPETESIRTRNYIEIWAALDDECINRLQGWSFDDMLKFTSLFFMLNVTRVSEFSQKSVQKLASKAKQLTHSQIVQALFYIGIMRKSPHDMHNLELELDKRFKEFSLDELAVMSMGFFKSKTPIRDNEVVFKIIHKIMENSKEINEVSLAALLKIIRYSLHTCRNNEIYDLLDTLQHEVPRLSIMCNVHLALLGTATLTLHKECLLKVGKTVSSRISEARLKDLERLVLTFGIFNVTLKTKECFFEKVINELKNPDRQSEIEKHARTYACCISFFSLVGKYPVDLMSNVLSSEFLKTNYGKHCPSYGKEILTIHTTAEIFCPQAKMNRLTDKCAIILAKKYTDFVPSEDYVKKYNVSERMFLDVKQLLKEARGGDKFVLGDHVLPHHQRGDIIICNDHDGLPVEIPENYRRNLFGLARRVPDHNHWIVLVIGGKNAFISGSDTPTGPFLTKIKELRALGYHAALVNWTTFNNLKTNEAKFIYISNLITNKAFS
ncbi:uncharacterized protein LOC106131292 [Amyelois transitella]|uniref:uncharacterized protein LOC106131292 n=1 Tax=Amyelois transitella TaxID=680683 RepID=UPI00298FCC6F|nr:uncharacterized protein LOC106131292 [Amyelois transitella]